MIDNVITEIGKGKKLCSTIANADILPTETWLGSIKKNTAAATMRRLYEKKLSIPCIDTISDIANPEECKKLSEKEYQKQLCFAIVCGIIEYGNKVSDG